ncbi:TPA: ABC transporter substrate-binding protein [Candidatus Bipolaricaulota bacterium]|nr:ABC transporter substrate-binding protein [Candidatus Bipolaricaulota bacterium]
MYVINAVFDELLSLDPETLKPAPYVAKSWEISEDGAEITFYLHEGIKFHNGEPLTAEDVAFTFNWIADPANGSPNQTEFEWLEEVVVIDDYTVKFVTKPDWAPYAPALLGENYAIVPKDTVLEMGDDEFNVNPVGSGPFKFVEWKRGDHITVVRNEDYWLTKPYLERIIFRPIPNLATMMLELETGGIDIADNVPAQDAKRFMDNPDLGVVVQQIPSLSYFYLGFNMSKPPSNDIRFRRAVYMSFDVTAAVDAVFQNLTGLRAYGAVPPALWANDREYLRTIALQEDDEQAKALFDELKAEGVIPEGYKAVIYCPPDPRRIQISTVVATNLIENGVDAEVQPLEWGPYLDLLYRSEEKPEGEYDMYVIGWSGSPDPNAFLYYLFTSDNATVGTANNFSFYMNERVDTLIKYAGTTLDPDIREPLYVAAQRIIFKDIVHIPLYHYIETRGVRTRVHDYQVSPTATMDIVSPFNNVWVEEG